MTERQRLDLAILRTARQIANLWAPLGKAIAGAIGRTDRPPTPRAITRARAIAEAGISALYGRSPLNIFTPDGRAQVGVARALVLGIRSGADLPLRDAERLIRANLRGHPDIIAALRGQHPPLPVDTARTWIDPNGYTLSDRVWLAGVKARARIDATLDAGIAAGRSAHDIAAELVRLSRPGSPTALSDALTLARTEIARSHAEATAVAAGRSPFIAALRYAVDPSGHTGTDQCDALVGVYPVNSAPRPPRHPNCRCTLTPELTPNAPRTIAALERWANGTGPMPRSALGWIENDDLTTALTGFPPQ